MTSIIPSDRVSYTVMYGGTPGHPQYRTEFGRVTRVRVGGSRQQPRATIAVENPRPGSARYVERYVTDLAPAPEEAVTIPGEWSSAELCALVMSAGELWDNSNSTRAGEYLSQRQMAVLDKAYAAYRAEMGE